MMKLALLLSLAAIPAATCHDFDPHHVTEGGRLKRTVTAEWTVMVYMSGDNELERFGCEKIDEELSVLGSTEAVQVVTLFDRSPFYAKIDGNWAGAQTFHAARGMTAHNGISSLGETDMGNASTLVEFVEFAKERSPANKYFLLFWGRGGFWHPGETMLDETSMNSLDMDELKSVLPSLGQIDLVAYDTSHSASVELASLWHGTADAIVFSEDEIVGTGGINYDTLLQKLNLSPTMSAEELAALASQSAASAKTFSAVALDSRFDTLLVAVSRWGNALLRATSHFGEGRSEGTAVSIANRDKFRQAFLNAKTFGTFSMDKDIVSAVTAIRNVGYKEPYGVNTEKVRASGQALVDSLAAAVIDYHSDSNQWGYGMTLNVVSCLPTANAADHEFYKKLDFATSTTWVSFISSFAIEPNCAY